jgi:hypothetical protein
MGVGASLNIPNAIDAEEGHRLRELVRKDVPGGYVEKHFPRWATTYATGKREADAEGCGPGMWLNAQLIQHTTAKGFEVPMTGMLFATGNWKTYMLRLDKDDCEMMEQTPAVALVVLLTTAVYRSGPCLDEIAAARDSKMKVILLRCEDKLPGKKGMWPLPQKLKDEGDMDKIQEYMVKRSEIVDFMCSENSIPAPGNTITSLPVAFDTFIDTLRDATGTAAVRESVVSPSQRRRSVAAEEATAAAEAEAAKTADLEQEVADAQVVAGAEAAEAASKVKNAELERLLSSPGVVAGAPRTGELRQLAVQPVMNNPGASKADELRHRLQEEDVDTDREFMLCIFIIIAVTFACNFHLLVPSMTGKSNGAGWLRWGGTLVITVMTAYAVADRDRISDLYCMGKCRRGKVQPVRKISPAPAAAATAAAAPKRTAWDAGQHDAATAPEGYKTDNEGAPCLEEGQAFEKYALRCHEAAKALAQALNQKNQGGKERRADLERHLANKYGLRYGRSNAPSTGAGARRHSIEVPAAFDECAGKLRTLVMRFPKQSAKLLAFQVEGQPKEVPFKWTKDGAPLRASGKETVNKALETWTDNTTSAADSALFSSLGIWISPYTLPLLGMLSAGSGSYVVFSIIDPAGYSVYPLFEIALVLTLLTFAATAWALRSNRDRARLYWKLGIPLVTLCFTVEAASVACQCWGPYGKPHAPSGNAGIDAIRDYPWQVAAAEAGNVLALLPVIAMATHPQHSFKLVFVAFPMLLALSVIPYLTNYERFHDVNGALFLAAFMIGVGTLLWKRRELARARAADLGNEDAKSYDKLWNELLDGEYSETFRRDLYDLWCAWAEAQQNAQEERVSSTSSSTALATRPRRVCCRRSAHTGNEQTRTLQKAGDLCQLLSEADKLNDELHTKLESICTQFHGELHRADVKTEARMLQKTFRTYGGHWKRLNDLCRASIEFETVPDMAACLRAINADGDLKIVKSSDDKMRMREDFDAMDGIKKTAETDGNRPTCGYRDVQLTVLLQTDETKVRGADQHLAEVQLHLSRIFALATEGGHKNYVLRRNMTGE